MSPVRIVILAKVPAPGLAKTRLIPALGEEGAAQLAARMLRHTLAQARAAAVGPVELCVTPSVAELFRYCPDLPAPDAITLQVDGDLGKRQSAVVARAAKADESVILVGTDCVALDASAIRLAAGVLRNGSPVMVPTHDGGYASC